MRGNTSKKGNFNQSEIIADYVFDNIDVFDDENKSINVKIKIGDPVFQVLIEGAKRYLKKGHTFGMNQVQLQYFTDFCSRRFLDHKMKHDFTEKDYYTYGLYLYTADHLREAMFGDYEVPEGLKDKYPYYYNFVHPELFDKYVKFIGIFI